MARKTNRTVNMSDYMKVSMKRRSRAKKDKTTTSRNGSKEIQEQKHETNSDDIVQIEEP